MTLKCIHCRGLDGYHNLDCPVLTGEIHHDYHAASLAAKDAEIAALRGQVGRLVRLVKALETPKRRGPFGGGTDPRDTEINNASVDCRQHNDLQPPAGKESSDG